MRYQIRRSTTVVSNLHSNNGESSETIVVENTYPMMEDMGGLVYALGLNKPWQPPRVYESGRITVAFDVFQRETSGDSWSLIDPTELELMVNAERRRQLEFRENTLVDIHQD